MALKIDFKTQNRFKKKIFPAYYFLASYPSTTILMVCALLVAGLAEGLSIAGLLPLINIVIDSEISSDSFIGKIVNDGFAFIGIDPTLNIVLLIIVLLMVTKSVLIFTALTSVGYVGARVLKDLRNSLTHFLANAQWSYFIKQRTGDLTSVSGRESDNASALYPAVGKFLADVIQVLVYAVMACSLSVSVTVSAIILGGIMMICLGGMVRMARQASGQHTQVNRSFMSLLIDSLGNMKALKAMGKQARFIDLLQKDIGKLYKAKIKLVLSGTGLKSFQEPIQVIAVALGLFFLLKYWEQSLDSLFVLVFLFHRMSQKLGFLQNYYQAIQRCIPSFWFVYETIEQVEREKEINLGKVTPEFKNEIKMEGVSFSYGEKSILKDISLRIPKGHFISLVGSSGSGKTTIVDLVIGLNSPNSGDIFIDQINISDIDKYAWRKMIGYVPQETFLFHDSILQNVTFGEENINEDQVISALKRADAWDFVQELPEGIYESVGEHGSRLSGGQKQRIAIARALVRNPSLLVFDEATTSLDPETERGIITTLKKLKGEVTILAISHQPAIKEAGDVVYVVENLKNTPVSQDHKIMTNASL